MCARIRRAKRTRPKHGRPLAKLRYVLCLFVRSVTRMRVRPARGDNNSCSASGN